MKDPLTSKAMSQTTKESLAAFQQHSLDKKIDPSVDAFGRAVADQVMTFRSATPI